MLRTKSPRCPHCKKKDLPAGYRIHSECVEGWLEAKKAKDAARAARKLKADKAKGARELRARKEAIKTIPQLIREAQVEFNRFIRMRDASKPCICCGKPLGEGDVGGAFDCGHWRSVGSAPHLRFDERNAHGQRKVCNRWGAGRAVDYRRGLVERIGLAEVEALECESGVHKWTREELISIRATYKAKRKELE